MQETKPKIDINKKYKTRKGDPVRILCTDRKTERFKYPVIALITFDNNEICSTYSEFGEYSSEDHDLDLIEVQPWEDFKIDDPVLVSKDGVEWHKRHFAGCDDSNGYPMAFNNGWTSFTAEDSTYVTPWKYCKKPEALG